MEGDASMGWWEIFIIGLGLSMDAFAVSDAASISAVYS